MENQGESPERIRVVTWNIEKGKRWNLLEECLETDPIRNADILCLQEVDEGMARSGNRSIANEIANRLGMRVVFGPAFKELTKGIGEELLAPGENTTALQGNATLSRYPILESKNIRLPSGFDHSQRAERREGDRHVLILRLDCGAGRTLTVANAHLEVFGSARCRRRQTRFILDRIPPGPAIVTGDFNTNTFNRGNFFDAIHSVCRLLGPDVRPGVLTPWLREPLFKDLRLAGFSWETFNDALPTCSVDLSDLEDRVYVPGPIRRRILSRYRTISLRLDFITCRGLRALSPGRTICDLPCRPSDHVPIACDVAFLPLQQ